MRDELLKLISAQREYIDAIPKDVALTLPEPPVFSTAEDEENGTEARLLDVIESQRNYINDIPADVVAKFPTMPGHDGDWADELIYEAQQSLFDNASMAP